MSEPILACLKESAWGTDGVLRRPLWGGAAAASMPWVAFGYDQPHTFEFLGRDHMTEAGRGLDDIEREAVANLRKRPGSWAEQSVKLSLLKKLRLLYCADDFLSAERILDRAFMREAEKRLRARGLLVGVPRRGLLLAMDGETGVERGTPFVVLVMKEFQAMETAPISPLVFGMKDGEIVGVVNADAEGEPEEDDEGADVRVLMVREEGDGGGESAHVIVTHDDFDVVARAAVQALARVLSENGGQPQFSGKVRFVIPSRVPEAIEEKARALETHLQGVVAEIGKRGVGSHEVSVRVRRSTF